MDIQLNKWINWNIEEKTGHIEWKRQFLWGVVQTVEEEIKTSQSNNFRHSSVLLRGFGSDIRFSWTTELHTAGITAKTWLCIQNYIP